jgi:pyruvate/2-oxoglutarate dehydrogenase complex dihydrolipoamide acyltransferase (E2) component
VTTQIKLPALGENIDSAGVLSILVSEGDVVAKDQDLIEVETDKATMPIPSPQAGKIVKVLVAEGDNVPVGGPIFEIESTIDQRCSRGKGPSRREARVGEEVGRKRGTAGGTRCRARGIGSRTRADQSQEVGDQIAAAPARTCSRRCRWR